MSALHYDILHTGLGWMGVLASDKGLRATTLPKPWPNEVLIQLGPEVHRARHSPGAFAGLHHTLRLYLNGGDVTFAEPLDLECGSLFSRAMWRACLGIPRGETRSYGWLAAQAGRPSAARAAGQAMAHNRIPIIIPCHRVVASDGALRGYGGGLDLKRHLLDLEKNQS